MSEERVDRWLESFAGTARERDLAGHMAHIARDVRVLGVPGFESLGYDDWYRQCAQEFPQGLITDLQYSEPRVRASTPEQVMFFTEEKISTSEGNSLSHMLEMVLIERDELLLLRQLRILSDDEAKHYGLR